MPVSPSTCGKTIRRRRSTRPALNRLRASVKLPMTRNGPPDSSFIAGTAAPSMSSATTVVLRHVSGSLSDFEKTTLGISSIGLNVGSSPLAVISAIAR